MKKEPLTSILRDDGGSYFEFLPDKARRPIVVRPDFKARKNIGGRSDLLARAAGVKQATPKRVLDATAGLCRDAFHFYSLGCEVIALEHNSKIFEVVSGYAARLDQARFHLYHGDAVVLMKKFAHEVDVVFLDPIFQEKKKSAQPGKESQLLRELERPPSLTDESRLLEAALRTARERVVVKRPLHAKPLAEPKELGALIRSRHEVKGKTVRYDVYVPYDNAGAMARNSL